MTVSAFDVSDFSNNTPTRWFACFFFLENTETFLFTLIEIFEFSLTLADDKELLSIALAPTSSGIIISLDDEWVLPILLQVHILIFCQTEGWKKTRWISLAANTFPALALRYGTGAIQSI